MPIVVSAGHAERYDLKTAPPDGYVVIRRLSHGEKAERRMINNKLTMKAQKGKKDVDSSIDMFHANVDLYNFKHCIIEHNLQDKDGRVLDFSIAADVNKIDGRVSEEITTYIDRENNFEADEDLGNSSEPSEPSS